jgi:hypothetical protein
MNASRKTNSLMTHLLKDKYGDNFRIFSTTVIRQGQNPEMTGYLFELDWGEKYIKEKLPIPLDSSHPFWNARGGNRGGRGLFVFNNILYVATALSILKYDIHLNCIGEISHPYFAGLHEIFVDTSGIWITASVHDLVLKLDLNGNLLDEWWGSESNILQNMFGFKSRKLNLKLDFSIDNYVEEYEQYCKDERLHINTVWQHKNGVYILSCRKNALIRIRPLPEQIILIDNELRSPHNGIITEDGRILINDTQNQCLKIYDLKSAKQIKVISTSIYKNIMSEQFASVGWQRGLAHLEHSIYLVGTSPATIFEVNIDTGEIGQIFKIDNDVRHCIHGLTATFNFSSEKEKNRTVSVDTKTDNLSPFYLYPQIDKYLTTRIADILKQTPEDFSQLGNRDDIQQFTSNPESVFLISFPRTGSHWLRMIAELYFDRPSLTRIFYKHNNDDYLFLHDHDIDLNLVRKNVIYLYRNPVDTVYSQLCYYKESLADPKRIVYWSELYGRHLDKWLHNALFCAKKTVITYEGLEKDIFTEFSKVTHHFGKTIYRNLLEEVLKHVSKSAIKRKTMHDQQVIRLENSYEKERDKFWQFYGELVWDAVLNNRPYLKDYFIYQKTECPGAISREGEANLMNSSDNTNSHENTNTTNNKLNTSSEFSSKKKVKIIGLIAARNEELFISQCLRALSKFTDAIIFLDDASDDQTLSVVESLASECKIDKIIRKTEWVRDEPGDRNLLLEAGREMGGTHFVVLDADEMFTSNLADGNILRDIIFSLRPGDKLMLTWIQLWRSMKYYRYDKSGWTSTYKDVIFCDDGQSFYVSDFIHTPRAPQNLTGKQHKLEGYTFGILHFQFVNWRNMLIKQAWYRCLEQIRHPDKSAEEINALYAPSKDETNLGLQHAPNEWLEGYSFFDITIFSSQQSWQEKQVLQWFQEYGLDHFAALDIWDIDWGIEEAVKYQHQSLVSATGKTQSSIQSLQMQEIEKLSANIHMMEEIIKQSCEELYKSDADFGHLMKMFTTDKVDFGTDSSFLFLRSGWSHNETLTDEGLTANWAIGESASLFLTLPKETSVQMTAHIKSLEFPRPQIMSIKVDDKEIVKLTLTNKWQWEYHSITIETKEPRPAVSIVEFIFSQNLTTEQDPRPLAVLFESLTLRYDHP